MTEAPVEWAIDVEALPGTIGELMAVLMNAAESDPIARNVSMVLENIRRAAKRAGRRPETIRLIAATKSVPIERIRMGLSAGLTDLGESRLQDALPKIEQIGRRQATWHFIGRLQTRKVKTVVGLFAMIHSVESVELAAEINRRAEQVGTRQPLLLEVNIGGEASKGGFAFESLEQVLPELNTMPALAVRGLMTIPPLGAEPEVSRRYFRQLRELAQALTKPELKNIRMDELSMGMSGDYEVAVEEGATCVRVGTAIWGVRRG